MDIFFKGFLHFLGGISGSQSSQLGAEQQTGPEQGAAEQEKRPGDSDGSAHRRPAGASAQEESRSTAVPPPLPHLPCSLLLPLPLPLSLPIRFLFFFPLLTSDFFSAFTFPSPSLLLHFFPPVPLCPYSYPSFIHLLPSTSLPPLVPFFPTYFYRLPLTFSSSSNLLLCSPS